MKRSSEALSHQKVNGRRPFCGRRLLSSGYRSDCEARVPAEPPFFAEFARFLSCFDRNRPQSFESGLPPANLSADTRRRSTRERIEKRRIQLFLRIKMTATDISSPCSQRTTASCEPSSCCETAASNRDAARAVRFDIDRDRRIGLPEAVFCAGKPFEVLMSLLERFARDTEKPILFTRLEPSVWAQVPEALRDRYDYDSLSRTAWHRKLPPRPGKVAVVSAGSADLFVTREAARTLEYLGRSPELFEDCGVAGLWRIEAAIDSINACDVVIVAAGLDAALASVLGGLTGKPLFAVPTSVGYGVAEHGATALRSMLASCAPGVAVLNIDNGYGAACAAARVLALLER